MFSCLWYKTSPSPQNFSKVSHSQRLCAVVLTVVGAEGRAKPQTGDTNRVRSWGGAEAQNHRDHENPGSWRLTEILRNGASLVAQWLRIHLPMQGTRVRALVREDPTCRGSTKPVCHNYWACALEPGSHNYWAHVPPLLKLARLEPVLCNKRSHRVRNPHLSQLEKSPRAAKKTKRSQK